jgi:hypothetical protein
MNTETMAAARADRTNAGNGLQISAYPARARFILQLLARLQHATATTPIRSRCACMTGRCSTRL